jgi:hypothetical protein
VSDQAEVGQVDPEIADQLEERAAIAQAEAGFPAEFGLAFAHLQMIQPEGVDEAHWQRAIDAMGRVLDQCREGAVEGEI